MTVSLLHVIAATQSVLTIIGASVSVMMAWAFLCSIISSSGVWVPLTLAAFIMSAISLYLNERKVYQLKKFVQFYLAV